MQRLGQAIPQADLRSGQLPVRHAIPGWAARSSGDPDAVVHTWYALQEGYAHQLMIIVSQRINSVRWIPGRWGGVGCMPKTHHFGNPRMIADVDSAGNLTSTATRSGP